MNEDEKLNKIEEEDEDDDFSLSEDTVVSLRQHTNSESSQTGQKKKKKFKPGKFISKHLKIKKDEKKNDSGGENSETRSEDSSKSPNLGAIKRGIAKRLSRRKKSQVSPYESGESSQPDEPLNNEKELEKLKKNSVNEDPINFTKFVQTFEKPTPPIPPERKSSLTENKKVQLQITISGKKIEKIEKLQPTQNDVPTVGKIMTTTATDKASVPLQYYKSQNDIMLPTSASAAVQVGKIRDEFFSVMVSGTNKNDNMKSISDDAITQSFGSSSTFKPTNYQVNQKSSSEKEIEKYSAITSSLNSIITTAKDSESIERKVKKNLKFPSNEPELKIVEELNVGKIIDVDDSPKKESKPKINVKEVIKEFEVLKIKESPTKSQLKSPEDIVKEFIKEEMKKSKVPIPRTRTSIEKSHPQSTVRTQEAHQPYHVSLSSSMDELKSSSEEIRFEVGTAVRPPKILSANTGNVAPLLITAIETESNPQESVDEIFHSPKSEPSTSVQKRDSRTRRKIAYIPQMTIYTPEEQELLRSNIIANSDSFDIPSLPPDSSMFPVFDESLVSNMTPSTPEKREYLYKILVIGELGTGKTSFIKRYVHQFFSQNYRATIGVDFALKVLNWDQSTIIRLQLWDIAGQERFGNMTRVYYKEAVGAFIVFDVTRTATFDAVNKWKTDLDSKVQLPDGSPIPCILLANKCDQPKQGLVTIPTKMDEYCKQNGFAGWFETSAKENTNIEESAKALVSKILLNDKLIHNDMVDGDRLILNAEDVKSKNFCSC